MNNSVFLSKALGIYLGFISIAFVVQERRLKACMMEMMNNPALLLVPSFVALIIGILLIVSHNLWVQDWRVLITLIGWSAFLKGAILILFPEFLTNWSVRWMKNEFSYYFTFLFVFLMGSILIYHGYVK